MCKQLGSITRGRHALAMERAVVRPAILDPAVSPSGSGCRSGRPVLSSELSCGLMRLVTMAFAMIPMPASGAAMRDLSLSPPLMPFSSASSIRDLHEGLGRELHVHWLFLVQ